MMNAQSNLLFDTALRYTQAGINILPAVRAAKFPSGIQWKKYQANPATAEQLREWFNSNRFDALCLLTGSGVEAIDFDCQETLRLFKERLKEHENNIALGRRLTVQQTPSGGAHFVYKVAETKIPGNQLLAKGVVQVHGSGLWSLGNDGTPVQAHQKGPHVLEAKQGNKGVRSINPTLIETRGTGGLILVAPTVGYRLLQGFFESLPVLTPDERDWLIDQARSFNQDPSLSQQVNIPINVDTLRQPWQPDIGLPGDRFSARATAEDVLAILIRHGWHTQKVSIEYYYVVRPGKEKGNSSTIRRDNGLFFCFSSSAPPFEINQSYSPFQVMALLDFGGDFSTASKTILSQELNANTTNQAKSESERLIIQPEGCSAQELMTMDLPEPKWAVKDFIPQGLTILGGKQKIGKSWLCLQLSIAVASGSSFFEVPVDVGGVLYLALEDNRKRLQARLSKMLGGDSPIPQGLHFYDKWPSMGHGGGQKLQEWLYQHAETGLVIVDTLARIKRRDRPKGMDAYEWSYEVSREFKTIADEYSTAIVLVHHLKKSIGEGEDVFDRLVGGSGLTAAADASLVLERSRNVADARLSITGRDLEEAEYALERDNATMKWGIIGPTDAVANTKRQQLILDYLKYVGEASPKEIADSVGLDPSYCRKTLTRLARQSLLQKTAYGKYSLASKPPFTAIDEIKDKNSAVDHDFLS